MNLDKSSKRMNYSVSLDAKQIPEKQLGPREVTLAAWKQAALRIGVPVWRNW